MKGLHLVERTKMNNSPKKKLVFISQWGSDLKGINCGNVKKVISQIESFRQSGYDVKEIIKEIPNCTDHPTLVDRVVSKCKNMLPFCTNNARIRYYEVGKADYYYIRFRGYDFYFRRLLKQIKKNNPNSKIVLEYPDYPYIVYKGTDPLGDFFVRVRDDYERKKCAKYIDRISTLLSAESINGVKTLRILNGLDVGRIKVRTPRKIDGSIHVLIVASLQRVHGVDLFLQGMKEYYNHEHDYDVYLHVVGGGEIVSELKMEAEGLEERVFFHGFIYDEELDEMYDNCDIGIEFLAPQRKQIKVSASLKSREYIARGFPFISACQLDVSDLGYDEYLKIEEGESPIDMKMVIEYVKTFSSDMDSRIAEMRAFAEKYLGMDYAMKNVKDFFEGNHS